MSKFKVGDKVRLLTDGGYSQGTFEVNDIHTVHKVGPHCIALVPKNGTYPNGLNFYFNEVELISTKSELQDLVDKANEGKKALSVLEGRIKELEVSSIDNPPGEGYMPVTNYRELYGQSLRIRVKPKPTFEPFTTSNGWHVSADQNCIQIGCKDFNPQKLKHIFGQILNNEVFATGGFYSCRQGIAHGAHILPWVDAEKIYEKLKEMEK